MQQVLKKRAAALLLCGALLWGTALPASAAWTQEDFNEAAEGNLLENPGFEDGEAPWDTGYYPEITEAAAYSGENGMRLTNNSTIRQPINIANAGDYTFNMAMLGDVENDSLTINLITEKEPYSFNLKQFSGSWERVSQTFTIPQALAGSEVILEIVQEGWYDISIDDLWFGPSEALPAPPELDMAENAVSNPGFETGIDGWEEGSTATTTEQTDAFAHSGNACLLAYSTNFSQTVFTPLPSDLPEGEVEITAYLFSVFLGGQGECSFQMGISTDPSYAETASSYITIPSYGQGDGWLKVSFTMTFSASEDPVYLVINGTGGYAYYGFFLDTVSVVPTHQTLPPPETERLLQNGGFEDGLSGWVQQGAPNVFATDGQVYRGTQSACFSYFTLEPLASYLQQTCPAGTGCILLLEALDKDGKVLSAAASPGIYDASKGWQKALVSLTAPAGTVSLRAKIGGVYCTGAFYVDNAALLNA